VAGKSRSVSLAGGALLTEVVRVSGLRAGLSAGLALVRHNLGWVGCQCDSRKAMSVSGGWNRPGVRPLSPPHVRLRSYTPEPSL
jgi:hypothetical protein